MIAQLKAEWNAMSTRQRIIEVFEWGFIMIIGYCVWILV